MQMRLLIVWDAHQRNICGGQDKVKQLFNTKWNIKNRHRNAKEAQKQIFQMTKNKIQNFQLENTKELFMWT